ncbi:hypothetical protein OUZ56_008947 [Daphnia magna]|uniref:Uncharacterized protein n=1 Tax=Daphnia magna TaxID=35525 RepID=A0ABR0AEI4_9CRUS|nr:hypothetical protein OUZ56_008947 [Daphnia magna]
MNGRFLKSALGGTGKHVLEMLTQVRKQVVGEKEQNRKTTILLLTSEEAFMLQISCLQCPSKCLAKLPHSPKVPDRARPSRERNKWLIATQGLQEQQVSSNDSYSASSLTLWGFCLGCSSKIFMGSRDSRGLAATTGSLSPSSVSSPGPSGAWITPVLL